MKLRFTDQQYLTQDQYKDSSNLDARIAIHQRFSTNPQGWFNWIFDTLVKLPAESKVLELGCGSAEMWKECASRIPSGWIVTLTDLSDGMLDAAWRNLVLLGRNFKFEQMDAQSIPYGDKIFDVVIANHMLYHVPDREKALAEIKRVLKDDGRLIATTVGNIHMQEMVQWLKRVNTNERPDMFSNPFTLENGYQQLQNMFSKVRMSRYIDNLHVTEMDPLIAYIRSSIGAVDLSEEKLGELKKELSATLQQEGKIFITKDSGLFEAMKSESLL
jgi:ubiquinone/menaquinone biosynthesis C-methylase UbiE